MMLRIPNNYYSSGGQELPSLSGVLLLEHPSKRTNDESTTNSFMKVTSQSNLEPKCNHKPLTSSSKTNVEVKLEREPTDPALRPP